MVIWKRRSRLKTKSEPSRRPTNEPARIAGPGPKRCTAEPTTVWPASAKCAAARFAEGGPERRSRPGRSDWTDSGRIGRHAAARATLGPLDGAVGS